MEELIEPDSEPVVEREVVTDEPRTIPTREVRQFNSPGLLRGIILAIIAVIAVVLLILLARWIYHSVHNTSDTTPASGNLTVQSPGASRQTANPQSSSSSNSSSSPSSAGQSSASAKSSLPNNGPGDVAAVFAGASLAAAGLHYIISLRKQARART